MDFENDFVPVDPGRNTGVLFDFSSFEEQKPEPEKKIPDDENAGYQVKYNKKTRVYYVALRRIQQDPIVMDDIPKDKAFRFPFMWDPYTGERKEEDPNGPMSFNPLYLALFFYKNRYKHLWTPSVDDATGVYSGFYGDSMGAGENCRICSRGNHPERYLFRLPIQDCYITDDHNMQYITMGPKLNNNEIKELDRLLDLFPYNDVVRVLGKKISLVGMKKLYDQAIRNSLPDTNEYNEMNDEEKQMALFQINKKAVDNLVKM